MNEFEELLLNSVAEVTQVTLTAEVISVDNGQQNIKFCYHEEQYHEVFLTHRGSGKRP